MTKMYRSIQSPLVRAILAGSLLLLTHLLLQRLTLVRAEYHLKRCGILDCWADSVHPSHGGCLCIDEIVFCPFLPDEDLQICLDTCVCIDDSPPDVEACPSNTVGSVDVFSEIAGVVARVCTKFVVQRISDGLAYVSNSVQVAALLPPIMLWTWRGGMSNYLSATVQAWNRRDANTESDNRMLYNHNSSFWSPRPESSILYSASYRHTVEAGDCENLSGYLVNNTGHETRAFTTIDNALPEIVACSTKNGTRLVVHEVVKSQTGYGMRLSFSTPSNTTSNSTVLQRRGALTQYLWYYFWLDRQNFNVLPEDLLRDISLNVAATFRDVGSYFSDGCYRINFNDGGRDGFWMYVATSSTASSPPPDTCNGNSLWTGVTSCSGMSSPASYSMPPSVYYVESIGGQSANCIPQSVTLQQCEMILSPNRQYAMVVQADGNLVVYILTNGANVASWSSTGNGGGYFTSISPTHFSYQSDGNLVMYDGNNKAIWATGWSWTFSTYGVPSAQLCMQDDGNFVLYDDSGVAKWAITWYPNVHDEL